jgi:hypothetical protein
MPLAALHHQQAQQLHRSSRDHPDSSLLHFAVPTKPRPCPRTSDGLARAVVQEASSKLGKQLKKRLDTEALDFFQKRPICSTATFPTARGVLIVVCDAP